MKQGTQGCYSGTTWRDEMGRELGGGSGWGHMYTPGGFISVYDKKHHNIVK